MNHHVSRGTADRCRGTRSGGSPEISAPEPPHALASCSACGNRRASNACGVRPPFVFSVKQIQPRHPIRSAYPQTHRQRSIIHKETRSF